MWRRSGTLLAAVVVVAAALVPLFGDPRSTPVTHPLWARLLLRALEMSEAVRTSQQASQVFALLAWRDSLSLAADGYLAADDLTVHREAGHVVVGAVAVPAEATYALAVVQPGNYLVRARIAGPAGLPVTAEIGPVSGGGAATVVSFSPPAAMEWVFGGVAHLDPGAYQAQFLLPPGCSLGRIEVAPPCLSPIEPEAGWRATAVTTDVDLAVTALQAIDAEYELPSATRAIEIAADQFLVEAPAEAVERHARAGGDPAQAMLSAGVDGLRAVASFEVPAAGLYSLSASGNAGAGQRWLLDGCRKAVICANDVERWRPVLTHSLAPGRHVLTLTLGAGATFRQLRIQRKQNAAADYVATLARLGFSPGPPGPVTRAKSLDAAAFVRERRRALLTAMCGDPILIQAAPQVLTAQIPDDSSEQVAPPQPAPVVPVEPVEPPIGPPLLPPQPPATPTLPVGS